MEFILNLDESKSEEYNSNINYNNEKELNRNMFDFNYVIGKGGFGKVWKVQYKKTKEFFALKEMSKRKILDKKSEKSINSERKFLSLLNHPFIVNMHYAFQDKDNLYLVMDMLSGGDLRYHCSRYRTFSEEQTRFFIACIIYSLEYIHSNNVIHRDIKPENLVLDDKGYVRITDFGIAKENILDNSSETSGTPGYMSPEVMNGDNHSFPADYFAVGVIGYEFLMGIRPFKGKNRKEIKEKMFSEKVVITEDKIKKEWSIEAADFINKLLERKKEKRLGAVEGIKELKEHSWLKYYPWEELEDKKLPAPFIPEQIDNFDKSYCESIEKISEETKLRYQKIYNSPDYKEAFVDFYYNKDIPKYQRKPTKSQKLYLKKDQIKDLINNQQSNTENEKSEKIEDNNINNEIKNEIKEKNIQNDIISKNKEENIDESNYNSKLIKNEKEEKKVDKKLETNLNPIKNILDINKSNNKEKNKQLNNNINNKNENDKRNSFQKIIINYNNQKRKTKDDTYIKEYISHYVNKKNEKSKYKNYFFLKIKSKEKNKILKKNSSLLFLTSRKINNNNKEIILNNQFPKKLIENHSNLFKYYLLNNNSNSNLITNSKDNKIKYQKINTNKKKNNSFRATNKYINNEDKKNIIKKIYNIQKLNDFNENKNNIINNNNNIDRKFINPKIFGLNLNKDKMLIKKSNLYINNYSSNNINSSNLRSFKDNNIYIKKLYNTNNFNSINNSINNNSKKEKSFSFKGKIKKFKICGIKNNMIYYNYIKNSNGIQNYANNKTKNFVRVNSTNDFLNIGNKFNKNDKKINNKDNLNKNKKKKFNSSSNDKNRLPFFKLS